MGGLAATFELRRDGHGRDALATAVRRRRVIRVRQGWYALPDVDPTLLRAVRVGGRATCLTGLSLHGCWVPRRGALHVCVDAHTARLRTSTDHRARLEARASGVRVHWRSAPDGGSRFILSPLECLRDAVECVDPFVAFVLGEMVLHEHPRLRPAWARFLSSVPQNFARVLAVCDGVCDSGTEAIVWGRLRGSIPMRRRVEIPGVGRVDFLVGSRLIVEVDGAAYHTDPERFRADRRRDAAASRHGYRVLRFSYDQVMDEWDEVEAAILAAVIRGDRH